MKISAFPARAETWVVHGLPYSVDHRLVNADLAIYRARFDKICLYVNFKIRISFNFHHKASQERASSRTRTAPRPSRSWRSRRSTKSPLVGCRISKASICILTNVRRSVPGWTDANVHTERRILKRLPRSMRSTRERIQNQCEDLFFPRRHV